MMHFDQVIAYVQERVNLEETLLIVTADHSHAFEIVGQPGRFQDVIGIDQYYSQHVSAPQLSRQPVLIFGRFFRPPIRSRCRA